MNDDGQFGKVATVRFEQLLPGPLERGVAPEPRDVYMERNAARYGVDLSNLV